MRCKKSTLAVLSLLFSLLLSCRVWSAAPTSLQVGEGPPAAVQQTTPHSSPPPPAAQSGTAKPTPPVADTLDLTQPVQINGMVQMGDPAGCLSAQAQAALGTGKEMLAYADSLIVLHTSLRARALVGAWNGYTRRYEYDSNQAIALSVADVKNQYLLQRILNALHVAGFVTWLRESARPDQDLHILAVPLLNGDWAQGSWAPYIQAYWQGPQSWPEGDGFVRAVLKLPPCAWMVTRGFAPQVDAGWWAQNESGWPNYASVAQKYLAATTQEANQVARQIDFLGAQLEGADTMCGPLAWSIMHDAGVFPPGMGAWQDGAKTFWLAKPTTNGRPWSLFPPGTFTVYHFDQPLANFDFHAWPLYPGDFFYTYSAKDGYDHMFVITEVDALGNVYSVTNLVEQSPQKKVTIERALLLNLNDPVPGVVHNIWTDRAKGRTGQAGFDVFRWDWMEKDILHQNAPYTVLPGDTLGQVSVRWKTPADWIARYNQLDVGVSLSVGQELRIPPNEDR
jgi:hypothetical protein